MLYRVHNVLLPWPPLLLRLEESCRGGRVNAPHVVQHLGHPWVLLAPGTSGASYAWASAAGDGRVSPRLVGAGSAPTGHPGVLLLAGRPASSASRWVSAGRVLVLLVHCGGCRGSWCAADRDDWGNVGGGRRSSSACGAHQRGRCRASERIMVNYLRLITKRHRKIFEVPQKKSREMNFAGLLKLETNGLVPSPFREECSLLNTRQHIARRHFQLLPLLNPRDFHCGGTLTLLDT